VFSVQEHLPVVLVGENGFAAITAIHDVVDPTRVLDSEFSSHRNEASVPG
jgi:hypothetical protein